MTIELSAIGRRFNRDWIFRNIDFRFESGNSYAVLGPNGSGKSTLLSVISGALTPSEGTIQYQQNGKLILPDNFYRHISFSAPYLDLIEEFTLAEMLKFHTQFKPLRADFTLQKVTDLLNLPSIAHKEIRNYSSGMKQRLKLALALLTDSEIVLLDEPTSNLDEQGVAWYQSLIEQFGGKRIIIVGSNQPHEYAFCREKIHINDYKKPAT